MRNPIAILLMLMSETLRMYFLVERGPSSEWHYSDIRPLPANFCSSKSCPLSALLTSLKSYVTGNVTVIKRETCNLTKYNNTKYTITSDMVCAGTVDENPDVRDTCQVTAVWFELIYNFNITIFRFGRLRGFEYSPVVIFFSTGRLWRTSDVQRCASRNHILWHRLCQ